jgi:hypothetical protein
MPGLSIFSGRVAGGWAAHAAGYVMSGSHAHRPPALQEGRKSVNIQASSGFI